MRMIPLEGLTALVKARRVDVLQPFRSAASPMRYARWSPP